MVVGVAHDVVHTVGEGLDWVAFLPGCLVMDALVADVVFLIVNGECGTGGFK